MLKLDAGFNPENILVLWKGYEEWRKLNYLTISEAQTITPTTTPMTTNTTATTVTATIACLVQDLILPTTGYIERNFSISVIVTNTGSSTSCEIPIVVTEMVGLTDIATYIISVTLEPSETKEVSYDEVFLSRGTYMVKAGDVLKSLQVG